MSTIITAKIQSSPCTLVMMDVTPETGSGVQKMKWMKLDNMNSAVNPLSHPQNTSSESHILFCCFRCKML